MFSEVKLNKNGWHKKLQVLCLGEDAKRWHFKNFCPYFWITIFCLMISPIWLPLKGLVWTLIFLTRLMAKQVDVVIEFINKILCTPLFNFYLNRLSEEDLSEVAYTYYDSNSSKQRLKATDILENWRKLYPEFKNHDEWNKKINSLVEQYKKKLIKRREEEYKKESVKEMKTLTREAQFMKLQNKMVKFSKFLFPVAGTMAVLVVGLLFWRLVSFLFSKAILVDWVHFFKVFGKVSIYVGLTAVALVIIVFVVWLITRLIKKCSIPLKDFFGILVKPLRGFGDKAADSIVVIAKRIEAIYDFFVSYFKAVKENHCPSIKWED